MNNDDARSLGEELFFEFIKRCNDNGLTPEQAMQTALDGSVLIYQVELSPNQTQDEADGFSDIFREQIYKLLQSLEYRDKDKYIEKKLRGKNANRRAN